MTIGRSLAMALFAASTLACEGCGLLPHTFRKLQPTPATQRARSVAQDPRQEDAPSVTALVDRLEDEDPVVRMAAQEELKRRTGRDFGFVAWAGPEERAASVARWRGWLKAAPPVDPAVQPTSQRRPRRRRVRPQPPATATMPPPTAEAARS